MQYVSLYFFNIPTYISDTTPGTNRSLVKRCVKRKWEFSHCTFGALDKVKCKCANALQGHVLNETMLNGRYARGLDVDWDEGVVGEIEAANITEAAV